MVEKDTFAGETNVCGGVLDASFADELELPSSIFSRINRWVCHFDSKVVTTEISKISFARSKFDRYLAERATSAGADLLCSTRAVSLHSHKDGMDISTMNRRTGERATIRSKIVVLADGPSTLAWSSLGVGFHGNPTNTAVGAICELEHNGSGDTYELFFDRKISSWGYSWIVPKPDHLNVGVMCLIGKMTTPARDSLDQFVNGHSYASDQLAERRRLRFGLGPIPLAQADSLSADRVLVVGDAAGMVDAIWGGGIRYSLRAAECVAEVASEALSHNRCDASSLSKYDSLWKQTHDYGVLRRSKLLADVGLLLQGISPDIYRHMVSFGVSHTNLQRLLKIRVEYS
jgi:flavin-dependent dehydrogenase